MDYDPDLPFRVYCLRGGSSERAIVASFARYIEAEVFVHCELLNRIDHGTDAGRYRGLDGQGRQAHYWIESTQVTASARDKI